MQMFLDAKELRELTDCTRSDAQIKRLHKMQIVFQSCDGKPKVLREHVLSKFGIEVNIKKAPAPFKFNWNGLNA